jgi:hypothetical protein
MSAAHSAETTPARLAPVPQAGDYAACDQCGAPLDDQQRYCVHCGRRRADVEEPALAWMASRRARAAAAPVAVASRPPRNPLALPALALALLPIAVGVGVLAGGHHGGSDQRLIDALRNQKAPIVRVGSVAGTDAVAAAASVKKTAKKVKAGKTDKTGGRVVAKTKYGVAHQVAGYKPSAAKVQADKKLVQNINKSIGKDYLQAQRNLPDTIVVPTGAGQTTSPGATGRGD